MIKKKNFRRKIKQEEEEEDEKVYFFNQKKPLKKRILSKSSKESRKSSFNFELLENEIKENKQVELEERIHLDTSLDSGNHTGDTSNYTGDTVNYTGDTSNYTGDTVNYTGDTSNYTNGNHDTSDYSKFGYSIVPTDDQIREILKKKKKETIDPIKENQLILIDSSDDEKEKEEEVEEEEDFQVIKIDHFNQDEEFMKYEIEIQKESEIVKINPLEFIPISSSEIIDSIKDLISENQNSIEINTNNINQLKESTQIVISDHASAKLDFFNDLIEYVVVLTEFVDHKEPDLIASKQAINQIHQNNLNNSIKSQLDLLQINHCINNQEISQIEFSISDANEQFQTCEFAILKFKSFKNEYPSEFENSYCLDAIVPIFDFYVSIDLLDWFPLQNYKPLDHHSIQLIADFDDLLINVFRKSIIPLFIEKLIYFNVFNHTECALNWINYFTDYFSIKDSIMQNLLDVIEDSINTSINEFINYTNDGLMTSNTIETKVLKIQFFVEYIEKTCFWKKYFPGGVLKKWITNLLVPIMSIMNTTVDASTDIQLVYNVITY
jgi:hypothetical protein